MKFGRFEISCVNFGYFRLDGGAMFGAVPKNLWERKIKSDQDNCIRLALRCLLLRDGQRTLLIDTGIGDKSNEKDRKIFGIELDPAVHGKFALDQVTDVILTHLHFDHAGGISKYKPGTSELELCFPQATVHLQKDNFENALKPNLRERASYLKENVDILRSAKLNLLNGDCEIYPDIFGHQVNGHTRGQQWIEIRDGVRSIVFPTDLVPTSAHLPVPFHMGYDICVEKLLQEKESFLRQALEKQWIVVFEHDAQVEAGLVGRDERGHFNMAKMISI